MTSTIITKNSSTATSVPSSGSLTQGELAVNVTDKRLFTKDSGGTVVEVGTNPSTLVLPSGSANGVTYLNGSKVLTSGSALTFDGTNLGVGGAASTKLHVQTTGADTEVRASTFTSGNVRYGFDASGAVYNWIQTERSSGAMQFAIGNAEQMRLTSTGLGIGTSSPAYKLDVNGAANTSFVRVSGGSGSATSTGLLDFSSGYTRIISAGASAGAYGGFRVYRANAGVADAQLSIDLDSSGNLGLGVTPSAWLSSRKVFQFGATGSIANNSGNTLLGDNYYTDSTPANKYLTSSYATLYQQTSGTHVWYNAPSGTAGNAITFTQAATLDANGNFMVGVTSTSGMYNGTGSNGFAAQGAGGILIQRGSDANAYLTKPSGYANSNFEVFAVNGSTVGSISTTGSATAYNTSSDYRLKNITGPITTSGAYIDSLNPVEGTWKADGSTFVGLIAHEVQEASRTQVATGTKDGAEMQAMDYSNSELIANLIAEVKSLRQRVATLEAK